MAPKVSGGRGRCAADLPGHSRDARSVCWRVPALSPGWKGSLNALLTEEGSGQHRIDPGRRSSACLDRFSFPPRRAHRSRIRQRAVPLVRVPGPVSAARRTSRPIPDRQASTEAGKRRPSFATTHFRARRGRAHTASASSVRSTVSPAITCTPASTRTTPSKSPPLAEPSRSGPATAPSCS